MMHRLLVAGTLSGFLVAGWIIAGGSPEPPREAVGSAEGGRETPENASRG